MEDDQLFYLNQALGESATRCAVLMTELMYTRDLIMEMMRLLREHPRTGYNLNLVLNPVINQIGNVQMGNFLTEEMQND